MNLILFVELIFLVAAIVWFFKTVPGQKVAKFLPAPFWVYFVSICVGTLGILPHSSPTYNVVGIHFLPAALILMLIGSPIYAMVQMGPHAFGAMFLGSVTMFVGAIVSFVVMSPYMPEEGYKMAGTMLGTWTGGSANMLAVKEMVELSDAGYGPLVIADTFLSYGWLAFLMMGVAVQKWFDKKSKVQLPHILNDPKLGKEKLTWKVKLYRLLIVLLVGFSVGETMVMLGNFISPSAPFLSEKAWAILLACTAAIFLAMTRLRNLEKWNASESGTFLLYVVLATMGVKTNLMTAIGAPAVVVFAAIMISIHGILLFTVGRMFKLPLFLLATASQANVGGPVSAPIVAGVYRPQAAQIGVLMAIFGAVFGTYIGGLGAWVCKLLQ